MSNSNPVNIAILGAGRQGKGEQNRDGGRSELGRKLTSLPSSVHAAAIAQIGAPARLYMIFDVFPAAAEALAASHVHAVRFPVCSLRRPRSLSFGLTPNSSAAHGGG
jgi:hypothetical protein